MITKSTIDIAPVRQWFEVFTSLGVNRKILLSILDCSESVLLKDDTRILTSAHHKMLEVGARATNIPGIMLLTGAKTTAENMGVVGHLMMNSDTLLGAGQQFIRYASILCESITSLILG